MCLITHPGSTSHCLSRHFCRILFRPPNFFMSWSVRQMPQKCIIVILSIQKMFKLSTEDLNVLTSTRNCFKCLQMFIFLRYCELNYKRLNSIKENQMKTTFFFIRETFLILFDFLIYFQIAFISFNYGLPILPFFLHWNGFHSSNSFYLFSFKT